MLLQIREFSTQGGVARSHTVAAVRRGEQMLLSWDGQLLTQDRVGSGAVNTLTFTLTLSDPAAGASLDDTELFDRALSPEELAEAADAFTETVATKYYSLNGQRVAKSVDGVVTWIHSDHLHSATILTDEDGHEIRRLAYRAFGEELENTGSGAEPKYSYTGKERDQSGLMYYGARYYDPALSRFITPDTLYDRGPQGLNRYSYALNSPIVYNDPTGHQAGFYANPAYHLVKWIQQGGSEVDEALDTTAEFLEEHQEAIGEGMEHLGDAMDVVGDATMKGGGAAAVSGGTCVLTTGGACAIAGIPVASGGLVATGAGALTKMAGNAIKQTGGHLKDEAKGKKRSKKGRSQSNPEKGRFDKEHSGTQGYDDALKNARRNAGDLSVDTQKMYDPDTGTLIGEQSADGKQGWRIDDDHVNWWNWSEGKKGAGGQYGHEWYPPEQSGPHSEHIGYAEWE